MVQKPAQGAATAGAAAAVVLEEPAAAGAAAAVELEVRPATTGTAAAAGTPPPLEPHESANTGPAPRAKARTLDEARVKKDRRVFVMGTPRVL